MRKLFTFHLNIFLKKSSFSFEAKLIIIFFSKQKKNTHMFAPRFILFVGRLSKRARFHCSVFESGNLFILYDIGESLHNRVSQKRIHNSIDSSHCSRCSSLAQWWWAFSWASFNRQRSSATHLSPCSHISRSTTTMCMCWRLSICRHDTLRSLHRPKIRLAWCASKTTLCQSKKKSTIESDEIVVWFFFYIWERQLLFQIQKQHWDISVCSRYLFLDS